MKYGHTFTVSVAYWCITCSVTSCQLSHMADMAPGFPRSHVLALPLWGADSCTHTIAVYPHRNLLFFTKAPAGSSSHSSLELPQRSEPFPTDLAAQLLSITSQRFDVSLTVLKYNKQEEINQSVKSPHAALSAYQASLFWFVCELTLEGSQVHNQT